MPKFLIMKGWMVGKNGFSIGLTWSDGGGKWLEFNALIVSYSVVFILMFPVKDNP